tara:strand:+ start:464 stop:1228 length:765 start_codon:yes stop_codon:yes gene_type:complete
MELLDEYKRLIEKVQEPAKSTIPRSIIGYPCTNQFFQHERLNTPGYSNSKMSTIEYWNTPNGPKRIADSCKKAGSDEFRAAVFLTHAPAQFPIVAAGKLYKHFNATRVFDPYAGWGDRCLAAMATDTDYVGVDSNRKLQKCFKRLVNYYPTQAEIEFISSKAEDTNYEDLDYDLLLTSPPFWIDGKMVECYADSIDDYDEFLESSLFPIMDDAFDKKARVCLHLPNQMYHDVKKEFGKANKIFTYGTKDKIYCW